LDHQTLNQSVLDYLVIGAGVAGCLVAGALSNIGQNVLVLEKARGTGGRLASRRLKLEREGDSQPSVDVSCNLGAMNFEVTHEAFRAYLSMREDVSFIDDSRAHVQPRNSLLARNALESASMQFQSKVLNVARKRVNQQVLWNVELESPKGVQSYQAQRLVLATPPKQAADILEEHELSQVLTLVDHEVQWVVLCVVDETIGRTLVRLPGLRSEIIESVRINDIGSTQEHGQCVLAIHAQPQWSRANAEQTPEQVQSDVMKAISKVVRASTANQLRVVSTHRWLYARPAEDSRLPSTHLSFADEGLFVCGDYFQTGSKFGVESAFLSANALINQLGASLHFSG